MKTGQTCQFQWHVYSRFSEGLSYERSDEIIKLHVQNTSNMFDHGPG